MRMAFKLFVSLMLLLANMSANALVLDFIDSDDVLIGSVRFTNTELDENSEWSIAPDSLTGGTNTNSEPGVVDLFVTTYEIDGSSAFTGSSWSDASGTFLLIPPAPFSDLWENNKISVELMRSGNFGEIYLNNSPLGEEALRVDYGGNTIIRSDVYEWEEGKALEIIYDDAVGAYLVDPKSKKSMLIYSPFVDSYFLDVKEEYCIANTEIYLQSNLYMRGLQIGALS